MKRYTVGGVLLSVYCDWFPGYQLVSWSKDRTLRIWGISEQLKEDLGGEPTDHTAIEDPDSSLQLHLSETPMATENERTTRPLMVGRGI